MLISQNQQSLIDAYFRNKLTEEMKHQFETTLVKDKVFKKEFIFQQNLMEAVRLELVKDIVEQARMDNILNNKTRHPEFEIVQNTLQKAKTENTTHHKWRRIRKLIIAGVAAACIVLAGFSGWAMHLKNDVKKAMNQTNVLDSFSADDIQQVGARREVIEHKLEEAKKAYQAGDFENTLRLLKELKEKYDYQPDDLIYAQAVVYTQMENYDESIKLLKKIIRKKSNIEHEARWYIALVYLKTNKKNKAKEHLNTLVQHSEKHKVKANKKLQKHYFL